MDKGLPLSLKHTQYILSPPYTLPCLLKKSALTRFKLSINHTVAIAGVQTLVSRAKNPHKDNSNVHIFSEV